MRPNFRFSECSCQILCSTLSFLYSHSIWHLLQWLFWPSHVIKQKCCNLIFSPAVFKLASFEDMLFFTLFILIVQWLCLGCFTWASCIFSRCRFGNKTILENLHVCMIIHSSESYNGDTGPQEYRQRCTILQR